MNLRQDIANNFSRHVADYNPAASLQATVAAKLAARLPPDLPPGPLLEVGCGTGLFSRHLVQAYPNRELHLTDLSPAMVAATQAQFGSQPGVVCYQLDGEEVAPTPRFSGIFSSFTLQWFLQCQASLVNLCAALLPGGALVLALQGAGSYPEWRRACAELGLPCTANPLPALADLVSWCGALAPETERVGVTQTFAQARDFFHQLKGLGAGTALQPHHLRAGEFRRLLQRLDQKQPLEMTTEVVYFWVRKP